jgi:hypothetical protein
MWDSPLFDADFDWHIGDLPGVANPTGRPVRLLIERTMSRQ